MGRQPLDPISLPPAPSRKRAFFALDRQRAARGRSIHVDANILKAILLKFAREKILRRDTLLERSERKACEVLRSMRKTKRSSEESPGREKRIRLHRRNVCGGMS